tara:strand:+ start:939 stop:1067 length:129 start_codon:yes stop_codon:yes gene_type:complete
MLILKSKGAFISKIRQAKEKDIKGVIYGCDLNLLKVFSIKEK